MGSTYTKLAANGYFIVTPIHMPAVLGQRPFIVRIRVEPSSYFRL